VLLGVTGSGKTFTMAKVIEATQRPALILAPNKTLAAQLYGEFKSFFPDNAVEYFVSYYDYYQPEAYVPRTDTYIEKDSRSTSRSTACATRRRGAAGARRRDHRRLGVVHLRHRLGRDLFEDDLQAGSRRQDRPRRADRRLVALQYKRNDTAIPARHVPRARRHVEIFPAIRGPRLARQLFGDEIESIHEFDPLTGEKTARPEEFVKIYANSHYVTPRPTLRRRSATSRRAEAAARRADAQGQAAGGAAAEQRTTFDLEMMEATGSAPASRTIRAI
jgi:excinuclease ABC subunit B